MAQGIHICSIASVDASRAAEFHSFGMVASAAISRLIVTAS